MSLHANPLYSSETVEIYDVCCRPEDRGPGSEEYSGGHHLVFPLSGAFVMKVAGREFVADPTQVLFFNRAEPYRVAHPVEGGDDCAVFVFRPDLLKEAIGLHQPQVVERPEHPFDFTHAPSDQRSFLFQERLRQRLLCGMGDGLMVDEMSIELLEAVMGHAYANRGIRTGRHRRDTLAVHREHAERTRLLLAGRFTEDLRLEDIARAVYSSSFHLARLFRRETGLPIHQYRQRLRLRCALERVIQGERDLTKLALDLGFASHSHLSEAFRRAFGMAPSECRRRASTRRLRELSKNLKAGVPALL